MKRTMTKCWLWMLIAVFLGLMGVQEVFAAADEVGVTISPTAAATSFTAALTTTQSKTFTVTGTDPNTAADAANTATAANPAFAVTGSTTFTYTNVSCNSIVLTSTGTNPCTFTITYTPTVVGTNTGLLTGTFSASGTSNAISASANWDAAIVAGAGPISPLFTLNGTALAAPTPTMTEWGMLMFMVFAGVGSIYYFKRYSTHRS
ncbi:hypothetical protein [Candidatus Magnetominusculus xianensis]|uniref:IPTL-CTERM protein sorting domain-containing protein n=1 Tax=Candidatus Magnetominusculus xianensis TaxID=1748249 RepID=A0ABR5SKB3_9BACT|nr:hypothetical protein [Candidatus Magnetominusculus xianensis]KWT94215.1 hypothetical protein ASN18_0260 [Candidatus Magnetominusculus xianensis]MBF0403004.1 hypothetical protein [Nitrospirota bacterium]